MSGLMLRVDCPTCDASADEKCATTTGRLVRAGHTTRWSLYHRQLRDNPSRWRLLRDDPTFGLAAGDVLVGPLYWLDPGEKITVDYREGDRFEPGCNQYRRDVEWIGWAS